MTIRIGVEADVSEVRKLFRDLGPGVDRAAARALNDTITTVRAEGARDIKARHKALKIGDIKKHMKVFRASVRELTASVATSGTPLSLSFFNPSDKKASGVTAVIGTQRVLMGTPGRRAFRILAYGNEYFVRKASTGRGVKRIRGPSLPGVFRATEDRFRLIANLRWPIVFRSRLQFEIDKAQRGARVRG